MRCKQCGGTLHHVVTTIDGDRLYKCHSGLTVKRPTRDNPIGVVAGIETCSLIHDERGKLINGRFAYLTVRGDKLAPHALTVLDHHIQD